MGRPIKAESIVRKMDDLAYGMLEKVNPTDAKDKGTIGLTDQMDVFEKVAKWVAVKNKLENDDGDGIASYKSRIYGAPDKPEKRPKPTNGGERLAEIKSRLPSSNDGEPDGDSDVTIS